MRLVLRSPLVLTFVLASCANDPNDKIGVVDPNSCRTCEDVGARCGVIDDNCGRKLSCGECTRPATCAGGGVPNVCGGDPSCVPDAGTCDGGACGIVADSCGNAVDCGECPDPPPATTPGMVQVPAGEFWMGCNRAVEGACLANDESPGHMVSLSAYEIDEYEVTQADWAACAASGACRTFDLDRCGYNPAMRGNWPVVCVTWSDATAYCAHVGKRLPTEAEWERAARGTMGATYPWGNAEPTCGRAIIEYCSTDWDPKPVGTAQSGASPVGALDMSGNVAEWVSDWYAETYYAGSPSSNPTGPSTGMYKVTRGGHFTSTPYGARAATRTRLRPNESEFKLGFRCAK